MNRRDFYVKQKVTEGELDDAFLQVEVAEQNLKKDAFGPAARGFLMASITVVEDAPQSQAVSIPVLLAWTKDGERVEKTTAAQLFDFAGDEDAIDPTIASVYAVFDRVLTDPRVDGLGAIVDFKVDETFDIERDLGTPAAGPVPPAIRTDGSILLCNVTIPAAAAVISNTEIDNTVQELNSDFPVGRLRNMTAGMEDAMEATAALTPSTANRVALINDFGAAPRGYKDNLKIVATAAQTVDVERATVASSDGVGGPVIRLMDIKNKPIDLAGPLGPGALDVGAVANAVYYVYAIGGAAVADDVIASLDAGPGYLGVGPSFANAPGYTDFRLIGQIVRNAGIIIPFRQIGEEYMYDDAVLTNVQSGVDPHAGAGPTGFIPLTLSPYLTPIAERVYLRMQGDTTNAQAPVYEFRSLGGPAVANWTNKFAFGSGPDTTEWGAIGHMTLHASVTQTVDWQRQQQANAHPIEISVAGMHLDLHHD